MVEPRLLPQSVRVLWANVAMATMFLLFVPLSFVLATHFAEPIANPSTRWVAIILGGSAGAGVAVLLAARSTQLGVFPRHDGLEIHDLLHTRTLSYGDIVDVTVVEITGPRGTRSYAPALVARRPRRIDRRDLIALPDDPWRADTRDIALIWLAAATESTAHRRAQAVQATVRFGPLAACPE